MKAIDLKEVLDQGITFEPSVLEWIKRLLNPLSLEEREVREVVGYSGQGSSTATTPDPGEASRYPRAWQSFSLCPLLVGSRICGGGVLFLD